MAIAPLRRTSTSSSIRRSATQPITIDLRNATLDGRAGVASPRARTRSIASPRQRTITIVPDTPAKRREYEEVGRPHVLSEQRRHQGSRSICCASSSTSGRSRRSPRPTRSRSRTRRSGSPRRRKLIAAIDKARPEVVIDVELLEVDRTQLREYGLQIASPGLRRASTASVDVNRDDFTLAGPAQPDRGRRVPGGHPGHLLPAAEERHQHADAGESAAAHVGGHRRRRRGSASEVPVPVTTFAPIATGGVNQQPITSFDYENIGVNIDITPRTASRRRGDAGAEDRR